MMTPMFIMLQDAPAKSGGGMMQLILMMVLIFVVMYFFMIRPQQKQQKKLAEFRNSLMKGQKVITAGGIHGTVKEIKETTVVVAVDKEVNLEIDKAMIMNGEPAQSK